MARPKKNIDPLQVRKLAELGSSCVEIAEFFGVDRGTVQRRFAAEIDKGRAVLKIKLRRLQIKSAENGSVAMQIFLGKVLLGQKEHIEEAIVPMHPIVIADADEL